MLAACAQLSPGVDSLAGASSQEPFHCPPVDCSAEVLAETGEVTDPATGRQYFVDYPDGYRAGDDVTVVLSLHGAGAIPNWQRHYFPLIDYKDAYDLVIITPHAPTRVWNESDDAHLHNIVNAVFDRVGEENIRAFWLAGHSQGGMTSRRLVCSNFFAGKTDGLLSLSGGRIGGNAPIVDGFFSNATPNTTAEVPTQAGVNSVPNPPCDFSFIFETGEHEVQYVPDTSTWAEKYGCSMRPDTVALVDSRPGYVSSGRQESASAAWGLLPRPGTAEIYVYGGCENGRVVADVIRLDKGHTEGLEPAVTEEIIKLMVSVKR